MFKKYDGFSRNPWTLWTGRDPVQSQHVTIARYHRVLLGFVTFVALDQTDLTLKKMKR